MELSFRWFGPSDAVSLAQIRQIPGVTTVVGACHHIPAGELWPEEDIAAIAAAARRHGLRFEVAEGLPVHEDIKLGLPGRDAYIENYIENLRRLAKHGVKVACYNFMPLFGWIRTDLARPLPDGSRTVAYEQDVLDATDPCAGDLALPGWNFSSQKGQLAALLEQYRALGAEGMWRSLAYFLAAVAPRAQELGIMLAVHPDDPPLPVFGLPRILSTKQDLQRLVALQPQAANGLTLCTGSLGSSPANDVPDITAAFAAMGRIHFVHARNVRHTGPCGFYESAHPTACGSLDMGAILAALRANGFDGYMRPDHGRGIWGETGRTGYGLYDRALGAANLNGLWEGLGRAQAPTC